jgi:two-component system sensor histidine kinase VicK
MKIQTENIRLSALQEVAAVSSQAVLIVDREERIVTFANTAASDLIGIFSGDSTEKIETLIDSVATSDRDYVKNKYVHIPERLATTDLEFRLVDSNGRQVWICCDAYLIDSARFVYVTVRDTTKARQHEDYLVEFGAKKNTLLDTLTHQLNGSLMLMNNLALRAGKLNVTSDQPALENFISLVHGNSKHCIDIINDLLIEEHSESPRIHVKFSRADVVKIVTYIFEELKKTGSSRTIVLETTAPAIFAVTDEVKLLQVVNNLASNSMKFTRAHDEIRFKLNQTDSSVIITVSDTGIGIPESLHPFVFEKHGPARRTGLNGERSIGLGLSISNHLTNLLGGRIWFESEEDKGSRFSIEIPKD